MDRKRKGTNAERELVHRFWKVGWACVRVAGSGSNRYPSPDLLAGRGDRRLVIECKTSCTDSIYLSKQEVAELSFFSKSFGAEPWIAVKLHAEWYFLSLDDLKESEKSFGISVQLAKDKGFLFEELLK